MKRLLLVFLMFGFLISDGQDVINESCYPNVELAVDIDTIYYKGPFTKDTTFRGQIDYGCFCNPCYILKPLNPKYKVISFKIIAESSDGWISERIYSGDTIGCNTGMVQVGSAKRNSSILIDCIKAVHENGNVYSLKNIVIRL